MDNPHGQNNFERLPQYQQDYICWATLGLVRRIQLNNPTLWAKIQAEAARMEEQNAETCSAQ